MTVLRGADAHAIREGALAYRALDDGRELVVYRMMPGQLRLIIGDQGAGDYHDAYCFNEHAQAFEVLETWDGDGDAPGRWHRHIGTGRRRRYEDGVLQEEWVAR